MAGNPHTESLSVIFSLPKNLFSSTISPLRRIYTHRDIERPSLCKKQHKFLPPSLFFSRHSWCVCGSFCCITIASFLLLLTKKEEWDTALRLLEYNKRKSVVSFFLFYSFFFLCLVGFLRWGGRPFSQWLGPISSAAESSYIYTHTNEFGGENRSREKSLEWSVRKSIRDVKTERRKADVWPSCWRSLSVHGQDGVCNGCIIEEEVVVVPSSQFTGCWLSLVLFSI
jgi:hypothetical protein